MHVGPAQERLNIHRKLAGVDGFTATVRGLPMAAYLLLFFVDLASNCRVAVQTTGKQRCEQESQSTSVVTSPTYLIEFSLAFECSV